MAREDLKYLIKFDTDDADLISANRNAKLLQKEIDKLTKELNTLGSVQSKSKALTKGQVATMKQYQAQIKSLRTTLMSGADAINQQAAALVQAKNKANKFGMVAQQVGYQVGDFFVQVQSGTSALVAFGQQGTQLAGLLPGLAGAVIGIGLAIGTMLLRSILEAKNAMEDLGVATIDYQKAASTAKSTIQSLAVENYMLTEGIENQAEATLRLGIANVQAAMAANKLKNESSWIFGKKGLFELGGGFSILGYEIVKSSEAQLQELEKQLAKLKEILAKNKELGGSTSTNTKLQKDHNDHVETFLKHLKDIEDSFDKQRTSMVSQAALLAHEVALRKNYKDETYIQERLEQKKLDLYIEQNNLNDTQANQLRAALSNLLEQKQALKGITDEEKARLNLLNLQQSLMPTGLASGRGGDPRQQGTRYQQEFGYKTVDELIEEFEAKNKINKSTQKAIDLTRELTDAQKQQVAIADSVSGAFGNFFMQLVDGTTSAKDAFRSMAADIIQQLYRILVVEQLVQSIAGAITGAFAPASAAGTKGTVAPPRRPTGVFGRYEGGGYTGSGPRSGGLDGKGGFMAMLHPRETVIDHTKGQGAGGTVVNQVFNISANTSDDTKRLITQTIAQASPAIINQSVGAVMNQRRRGGAMKSAFG
jgi:hypothetical protein